jgi:hypothetical protein
VCDAKQKEMKTMTKARKFAAVAFAFAGIMTGVLASMHPASAAYYCHWTPRGTVCTQG